MLLGLSCTVVQPSKPMEADRSGERVAAFALVQLRRRLPSQLRLLQPVQGEKSPLDTADLSQCERQPVLSGIGAETLEHQRGADRTRAHRSRQPQHVIPLGDNQLFLGATADKWSQTGQVEAGPKAYSLRSAKFGMRGAKRKPSKCARANT